MKIKMKIKELMGTIFLTLLVIVLTTTNVEAASYRYKVKYTSNTYVRYLHEDSDISDPYYWKYKGEVSIRGADWIKNGLNWSYPKTAYLKMTEPNRNKSEVASISSKGPNDKVVWKDSFILKDFELPSSKKTYVNSAYISLEARKTGNYTPTVNEIDN